MELNDYANWLWEARKNIIAVGNMQHCMGKNAISRSLMKRQNTAKWIEKIDEELKETTKKVLELK